MRAMYSLQRQSYNILDFIQNPEQH